MLSLSETLLPRVLSDLLASNGVAYFAERALRPRFLGPLPSESVFLAPEKIFVILRPQNCHAILPRGLLPTRSMFAPLDGTLVAMAGLVVGLAVSSLRVIARSFQCLSLSCERRGDSIFVRGSEKTPRCGCCEAELKENPALRSTLVETMALLEPSESKEITIPSLLVRLVGSDSVAAATIGSELSVIALFRRLHTHRALCGCPETISSASAPGGFLRLLMDGELSHERLAYGFSSSLRVLCSLCPRSMSLFSLTPTMILLRGSFSRAGPSF